MITALFYSYESPEKLYERHKKIKEMAQRELRGLQPPERRESTTSDMCTAYAVPNGVVVIYRDKRYMFNMDSKEALAELFVALEIDQKQAEILS